MVERIGAGLDDVGIVEIIEDGVEQRVDRSGRAELTVVSLKTSLSTFEIVSLPSGPVTLKLPPLSVTV